MTQEERRKQLAGLRVALTHSPLRCAQILRSMAARQGLYINVPDERLAPIATDVWRERVRQAIARLEGVD